MRANICIFDFMKFMLFIIKFIKFKPKKFKRFKLHSYAAVSTRIGERAQRISTVKRIVLSPEIT